MVYSRLGEKAGMVGSDFIHPSAPYRYRTEDTAPADVTRSPLSRADEKVLHSIVVWWKLSCDGDHRSC